MRTKYKVSLIVSGLLILAPILIGVLTWDRLPDLIPNHFNFAGEADGYTPKLYGVFALPLILFVSHYAMLFIVTADPKRARVTDKIYFLVMWMMPLVSWVTSGISYSMALGRKVNITLVGSLMVGFIFVVIGNYFPKLRQNYTIGIRLPWTLADEDNWNRTHRLAGWLYMICGVACVIFGLLRVPAGMFAGILIASGIPTVYSYLLYRKKRSGE